ncbi:MAG: hypothetical protein C0404_07350 [Verrucomicrobia bacterium]|nr:hypothetical protein [Verrucomicrobiota bacterium]
MKRLVLAIAVVEVACSAAIGIDISSADGSQNLYLGKSWQVLVADGGTHTITPSGSTYSCASRSGGSPGLNMGTNGFYTGQSHSTDAGWWCFDLDGGNITANASSLSFYKSGSPSTDYNDGSSLFIKNAGAISIGGMDFRPGYASWGNRNSITIGEPTGTGSGPATGDVQIAYVWLHNSYADSGESAYMGAFTNFSRGNVLISSGSGMGDILVYNDYPPGNYITPPTNVVCHNGALTARNIDAHAGPVNVYHARAGSIVLQGDYLGTGSGGACVVSNIYTYMDATDTDFRAGYGGHVKISGYSSVRVNDIKTWNVNNSAPSTYSPGNVTITNITGDITITGVLDLHSGVPGNGGPLTLVATAPSSKITLPDLNLNNMSNAVISPGSKCIIKGDFIGFNTNANLQTQLRMPAGRRMFYFPDRPNNTYLARKTYVLADVNGVPANGGVVMPYVSPGTVITLK